MKKPRIRTSSGEMSLYKMQQLRQGSRGSCVSSPMSQKLEETPHAQGGLTTPHKPDRCTKESSQVVTPAPTRTDLPERSSSGLTVDVDITDGAQWTQKPSCRVQSSPHTRAGGAHGSFVEAGRSEINKDESTTAGGARTEAPPS